MADVLIYCRDYAANRGISVGWRAGLPDGDKEKQLLQGLLNQRDKIDEVISEGRLF